MILDSCSIPEESLTDATGAARGARGTHVSLSIYPALRPRYGDEAWRRVFAALALSARERQLVCRIFRDQRESDMARSLGISQTTIHTYLRRLYRKLSVTSRVGLVLRIVAEHQRPARGRSLVRARRRKGVEFCKP